jgi:hypothetical protein
VSLKAKDASNKNEGYLAASRTIRAGQFHSAKS